jgi:hypothetical protein
MHLCDSNQPSVATQAQARLVAAQEAVLLTGRDLKTAKQAYDDTAADFLEAVDYADAVVLQVSCSDTSATAVLRVVSLNVTLFCFCLKYEHQPLVMTHLDSCSERTPDVPCHEVHAALQSVTVALVSAD